MKLGCLDELREPLFAARLLREETLLAPIRPGTRAALGAETLRANHKLTAPGAPLSDGVLHATVQQGLAADGAEISEASLRALAETCGDGARRTGPGVPFHGRAAPTAPRVPHLLAEIVQTVSSPVAIEIWPPPARAFALHFLLRLVQPFACDSVALAMLAEAQLLAADGFPADVFLLPSPAVVGEPRAGHPDPDALVVARAHALVEGVAATRERVRAETARAVLLAWGRERAAGLNARQERLLAYLASDPGARRMRFEDYVGLHSGRRSPSLRSLQRDWKGLREAGWLVERDGEARLSTAPLERGAGTTS